MLLKKKIINNIIKKFNIKSSNKSYRSIIIKKKTCKMKNTKVLQLLKRKLNNTNVFNCKSFVFIDQKFKIRKNKTFKNSKKKTYLNFKFIKLIEKNVIKNNKNIFSNIDTNIFLLKPLLIFYNFCHILLIKNKIKTKKKNKIKNFYFKVKRQKKLLLLNIFFNKKSVLKPTIAHVKKPNNLIIKIKFMKFFLKKLVLNKNIIRFAIHFKIKKKYKDKISLKKKRKFILKFKIFKFFLKFILICKKILYVDIFFKPFYNRSHANNNLKNKKLRRKKRKKKKRS